MGIKNCAGSGRVCLVPGPWSWTQAWPERHFKKLLRIFQVLFSLFSTLFRAEATWVTSHSCHRQRTEDIVSHLGVLGLGSPVVVHSPHSCFQWAGYTGMTVFSDHISILLKLTALRVSVEGELWRMMNTFAMNHVNASYLCFLHCLGSIMNPVKQAASFFPARTHTLGILRRRRAGLFVRAGKHLNSTTIQPSHLMLLWDGKVGFLFPETICVSARGCDVLTWRGVVKSIAVGFQKRNHFSIIGTFSFSFKKYPALPPQLWIPTELRVGKKTTQKLQL